MAAPQGNQNALGNNGGRPTKYKPEYCELVQELGAKGYSLCEIAAEIGVVRATLKDWCTDNIEFSGAMELAQELSQAWWEKKGRDYLIEGENEGKGKINTGLYSRSMSARFPADWRENTKTELTGANGAQLVPEISLEEAAKRMAFMFAAATAKSTTKKE